MCRLLCVLGIAFVRVPVIVADSQVGAPECTEASLSFTKLASLADGGFFADCTTNECTTHLDLGSTLLRAPYAYSSSPFKLIRLILNHPPFPKSGR